MAVEKKGIGADLPRVERFPKVEPRTPTKIWRRELIGTGSNAAVCLALIGKEWDGAEYDGEGHNVSFEFELDDHLFRVTVSPVPGATDPYGNPLANPGDPA